MAYKGLSLEGKKALVFGGTSGLGRSIALGFAEAGADVAAVSRHADAVAKTAAEIRKLGPKALELTGDVVNRADIERVIDAMRKDWGRIDILVNSAGTTKRAPSFELADEDWNRILNLNLNGTWYACQMVGRVMKEQNYGRIVNIASIGAFLSLRSEERRVGKECRSRWWPHHRKKKARRRREGPRGGTDGRPEGVRSRGRHRRHGLCFFFQAEAGIRD